ncbi:BlaI/MecI/CopY family transcriptional regulator [Actinomadura scrupuli]|uniref:BlaI/MecI/CopY family transcriptional regulator n=1 Tax=Actinomadura scrupuli TaxID=559629 RepID=UPI003D99D794
MSTRRQGRPHRGLEQQVFAVLATAAAALTPGQVRDELGDDLAYTTVMTVLARMLDKGLVTRERTGRAYAYTAVVDEAEVAAAQMRRLLDARDDRGAVLTRFAGALSAEESQLLIDVLSGADAEQGRP